MKTTARPSLTILYYATVYVACILIGHRILRGRFETDMVLLDILLGLFLGVVVVLEKRSGTPWHDRMDALETRIRELETRIAGSRGDVVAAGADSQHVRS